MDGIRHFTHKAGCEPIGKIVNRCNPVSGHSWPEFVPCKSGKWKVTGAYGYSATYRNEAKAVAAMEKLQAYYDANPVPTRL